MTTTTTRGPASLPIQPIGQQQFRAAVRGAAATILSRPVMWLLVGVWLLQVLVFAYVVNSLLAADAEAAVGINLRGEVSPFWPLASMPMYGAPVFVLIGVLASASDYRYGTLRLILPRFRSRVPFIVARWICVLIIAVVAAIATTVLAIGSSLALSPVTDLAWVLPSVGDMVIGTASGVLIVAALATFGFTLGVMTRSVLSGLLFGLGWTIGLEVLLLPMLTPLLDGLVTLRALLPGGAAGSLAGSLGESAGLNFSQTVGVTVLVEPGVAIISLVLWTVLGITASALVFRRRDV